MLKTPLICSSESALLQPKVDPLNVNCWSILHVLTRVLRLFSTQLDCGPSSIGQTLVEIHELERRIRFDRACLMSEPRLRQIMLATF